MNDADRPHFARAMARLFAIYGDELTDNLLEAWWGGLAEHPLTDVLAAMNLHAKDPKAGMFRPTPAHIIGHVTETLPALRRQRAALRAQQLANALAPHDEAIRRAATDHRLGLLSSEAALDVVRRAHLEISRITATHQRALTHDDVAD